MHSYIDEVLEPFDG